ncbi:MAG TPA: hypothetical protein VEF33_05410 [Syntrophales bacterium]|nr:hypothetical protein [Syntrophales bacterium]
MKETKNFLIPDYRRSLPVPENSALMILFRQPENDSRQQEKELVSPTNNNLAPDHLTATYWG